MKFCSLVRKSCLRAPKEAPRCPGTPKHASQNLPYAAKTAPKPSQDDFKLAPRWPQDAPNGPKTPRNASKAPQNRSKALPRCHLHRLLRGFGSILEGNLIDRWPFSERKILGPLKGSAEWAKPF